MADKNNGTNRSILDSIIKVVFGAVATLLICGFATLEQKKLDKEVFEIYKEYRGEQLERIESSINKMDAKIDIIIKNGKTPKVAYEEEKDTGLGT